MTDSFSPPKASFSASNEELRGLEEVRPRQKVFAAYFALCVAAFALMIYCLCAEGDQSLDDTFSSPSRDDIVLGRLFRRYEVLDTLPHSRSAFTQGLVMVGSGKDAILYEGTGQVGESRLRKLNATTGELLLESSVLSGDMFGEGIAYYTNDDGDPRIIQLTWTSRRGFIYDPDTLEQLSSFTFSTTADQGWGITVVNNSMFVVSDGSSYLHFWNMTTLEEIKRVQVIRKPIPFLSIVPAPQRRLNELEYDPASHTILANVFQTNRIVRIDADSGLIVKQYRLRHLFDRFWQRLRFQVWSFNSVLNGIALVADYEEHNSNEYWVTGKDWPKMFRIRLRG